MYAAISAPSATGSQKHCGWRRRWAIAPKPAIQQSPAVAPIASTAARRTSATRPCARCDVTSLISASVRHGRMRDAQVIDQRRVRGLAATLGPQHRRRMGGRDDGAGKIRVQRPPSLPGDPELRAQERLRGGRAEKHEHLGAHRLELGAKPRQTRLDLGAIGLVVDPALAPARRRAPLEVLDDVRQVDLLAVDAGLGEGPIEKTTRRPDERGALDVLAVTGLLPDEEHRGGHRPRAENRLGGRGPERASATAAGTRPHTRQTGVGRRRARGRRTARRHPNAVPGAPVRKTATRSLANRGRGYSVSMGATAVHRRAGRLDRHELGSALLDAANAARGNGTGDAASVIAYYGVTALPAVSLSTLGLVVVIGGQHAVNGLLDRAAGVLPADAISLLHSTFDRAVQNRGSGLVFAAIGIALAIWSAIGAMSAVMRGLNRAYRVDETRGTVRRLGAAFAMLVLTVLAAALTTGLLILGPVLSDWLGRASGHGNAAHLLWW